MAASTVHADGTLARRMEAALAYEGRAYVRGWQSMDGTAGACSAALAGGQLLFTGVDSPVTQAVGLAMDGPVTDADFGRLLAFFAERQALARVSVCPLAHPSLVTGLGRRTFRVEEFENALVRPLAVDLPDPPAVEAVEGVEIRLVSTDEERAAWVSVMAEAWLVDLFAQPGMTAAPVPDHTDRALATVPLFIEGVECYLATVEGAPAGGGALSLHDGIGTMFADATLPQHRGRGVQTALLHARLARSVACGCDLAAAGAAPGGTSQRNFERLGFHVAYTSVMMVETPGGDLRAQGAAASIPHGV